MFGYVNVNKLELKVKDFNRYRSYYCGLCNNLKKNYGPLGQFTLSYDMTFLVILLTSLYESETISKDCRCMVHPIKKHTIYDNSIMDYVSDMNIALTYHHFLDDWNDDKSMKALASSKLYQGYYKKIEHKYDRQCKTIIESLKQLQEYEKNKIYHIDEVSATFGTLMSELFVMEEDMWSSNLRKIGFYLGKYIYILDAYDDIEEDLKKNRYNPLIPYYEEVNFHERCNDMLMLMIAECSNEFEKLPCIEDIEILRNILYDGVWIKFKNIQFERKEQQKNDK